ncbi:uncharacterized protein LOC128723808 [Anopheles nili]|uniref:uncharacterized protein LOC128723808 n=1 Tax=Anopheles nili TaxID=185578 RepID=UPI00237BC20E|nr:uncharacterized protein LOC128723808 [Anopheles nili]
MDDLKKIIRSLAISNVTSVYTVAQLDKDFRNLEGYSIPFQRCGFRTLDSMLHIMSDALRVSGYGPNATIQPIVTSKNVHISELVKKSKKSTNRRRINTFSNGYSYPSNLPNDYSKSDRKFDSAVFAKRNDFVLSDFSDDFDDDFDEPYSPIIQPVQNKILPAGAEPHQIDNHARKDYNSGETSKTTSNFYATINTCDESNSPSRRSHEASIFNSELQKEPILPADAMALNENVCETPLFAHLKPGANVKAMVTAVLDPSKMYVHLVEHTDKLLRLAPYIDSFYNTTAGEKEWMMSETMAQAGLYCVAKYHNRWHRALIKSVVDNNRVLLLYIDYGYMRYVSLSEIRYLTRELSSIPYQTIQIALPYLNPVNGIWSNDCKQFVAKSVYQKVLQMDIISVRKEGNVLNVILTESPKSHNDLSLNKLLALRDDVVSTSKLAHSEEQ